MFEGAILIQGVIITILLHIRLSPHTDGSNSSNIYSSQLKDVKQKARVIVAVLGDKLSDYVDFLTALQILGMSTSEYSPILCITRYWPTEMDLPWMQKGDNNNYKLNKQMLDLFQHNLVLVNDFYSNDQINAFIKQMVLSTDSGIEQRNKLLQSIQLYECFWTYALALWRAYSSTMDLSVYQNGTLLANAIGQNLEGPFGTITLSGYQKRIAPYKLFLILSYNSNNQTQNYMDEIANISITNDCSKAQLTADEVCVGLIANLFVGNQNLPDKFPQDIPNCGFNGELCDNRSTIIIIASVIVVICLGIIIFLCFRRVKKGETTQMPYYVSEQLISFVDVNGYGGSSSMSLHSLNHNEIQNNQQQNEQRHDSEDLINDQTNQQNIQILGMRGGRGGPPVQSKHIGTLEQSFVIIECYNLKEKLSFDKKDMQLLFQMKQIVHDNINPFLGVCVDRPNELMVIWRYCFRGTLEDLLFPSNKETAPGAPGGIGASVASLTSEEGITIRTRRNDPIDINFKSAFVRDIIKGLDFIHSSSIGYHGALTSSRCLIDSHWILKLSGFGTSRMLYKWRFNNILSNGDRQFIQPLIPNNELHYYAPEFRTAVRAAVLRNKEFSNFDGQTYDMYAFGAILYEILYRRRIVETENYSEGTNGLEALEDDVCIFSAAAEEHLPIFSEFPNEDNTDSTINGVVNDRVHPDLVALMRKCFGKPEQRPDANMVRKITDATLKMPGSLVDNFLKNMEQYTNNLENLVREQTGKLEEEQQMVEQILLELLPKSVVDELRLGLRVEPQFYGSVTVMYSDIVGFTSLCSESAPMEVVDLLNGMFRAFDEAISRHQAFKVETIGDAYMVASGVPQQMDSHVREIASVALMQRDFLCNYEIPHRPSQYLHCRWGFNSGSVFTGVVGITAPRYCVFGTTVTLSAKMENSGQPDKIQMTLRSYQLLSEQFPEFKCAPRGGVRIEGVGTLLTYWLEGLDNELLETDRTDSGLQQVPIIPRAGTPPTPPPII
uniref:Guanylate cyclase n=1 Tax=Meloidogyne hapla TaxID=6305 RepID=A0A1I8BUK6_MELHA